MEDVVCVGTPACNVGRLLSVYKNYKVLFIDDKGDKKMKNSFNFNRYKSPELYEESYDPGIDSFLQKKVLSEKVTFMVCGTSMISGALLRMMQTVKNNRDSSLRVLYIKPDNTLLSEVKKLQERVVFQVLQQYARSGILENMTIVSNDRLSAAIGDVPIMEHHAKINELLSSTFHMVNVFENTKSVTDTFSAPKETSRISTYCVFSPFVEDSELKLYDIEDMSEARYYYGIPESSLREEKTLYREILQEMKKRVEIYSKVSYGIYETSYDTKIGYGVLYSNQIQEENNS